MPPWTSDPLTYTWQSTRTDYAEVTQDTPSLSSRSSKLVVMRGLQLEWVKRTDKTGPFIIITHEDKPGANVELLDLQSGSLTGPDAREVDNISEMMSKLKDQQRIPLGHLDENCDFILPDGTKVKYERSL